MEGGGAGRGHDHHPKLNLEDYKRSSRESERGLERGIRARKIPGDLDPDHSISLKLSFCNSMAVSARVKGSKKGVEADQGKLYIFFKENVGDPLAKVLEATAAPT